MTLKNCIPLCFLILTSCTNPTQKIEEKEKEIIMAIFAHPDDEAASIVSPLLTKYAREGYTVYLVVATKGEIGVSKHANIPAGDSLAMTRAGEATCACEKLGIKPPILLGLGDASLAKDFTGEPLRRMLDSIFRLYEPDILITFGPEGGYGHMDHRMVSNVVTELFQSENYSKPKQLYFTGMPSENLKQTPNFNTWVKGSLASCKPVKKEYLTMRIKCSKENFAVAVDAMYCHKSQYVKEDMEGIKFWMTEINRDTVYLRPFSQVKKISYSLF